MYIDYYCIDYCIDYTKLKMKIWRLEQAIKKTQVADKHTTERLDSLNAQVSQLIAAKTE